MLRSSDGGQTFSAPFTVHQDRQEITHRFDSVAFDAQGVLHTLWVDKRDQPPKGSTQKYAGAAIYRNESKDGGMTFGPDTKLADHSCECCRIGLARNPQGQLQATWRHVFDSSTRDHAFASVGAPANRITRSTHDDWQINACPHHGPGLALNAGTSGYHTVWFGIRKVNGQDQAAVRYARLNGQGEPLPETLAGRRRFAAAWALQQAQPDVTPGQDFLYSNVGYMLVGMIWKPAVARASPPCSTN
jgi:hypothetical protein